MGKDLSEMTSDELWELFLIFLVAHNDRWKDSFQEIEKTLTGLLSDQPVDRISHIGSTAIQGIWAKNIIDVMIEIPEIDDMKDAARILEQNGFVIMSVKETVSRSIKDILKMDLRTRYIISIGSIAFCCISTGVFAFPQQRAAEIAVRTVTGWLNEHPDGVSRIIFNVFKNEDRDIYEKLLS